MSEKIKLEMISRRGAFSLLGLAAALSLVVPAALITATDAEARVGNPGSAVSVAGAIGVTDVTTGAPRRKRRNQLSQVIKNKRQ